MTKNMLSRMTSCLIIIILLGSILAGCAKGTMLDDVKAYNIAVVLKTMDSEHWQGIRSGMEYAADQHNVKLTLLYPSDESAKEEQEVMIQDALDTKIDALIVAPCDSTNTGWFVDKANEKDIKLFTSDTRALDRDITYIGVDNIKVGKLAAEYINSNMDQNSKVGIITGARKQAQTIDRESAFVKELGNFREINDADITLIREN
ncbi:MAG: substrate-binding domain-containing protein, partial [Suipraeoptans sp.]